MHAVARLHMHPAIQKMHGHGEDYIRLVATPWVAHIVAQLDGQYFMVTIVRGLYMPAQFHSLKHTITCTHQAEQESIFGAGKYFGSTIAHNLPPTLLLNMTQPVATLVCGTHAPCPLAAG